MLLLLLLLHVSRLSFYLLLPAGPHGPLLHNFVEGCRSLFCFVTKRRKKWNNDLRVLFHLVESQTDSIRKKNCWGLSYGEVMHALLNDKQGLFRDRRADGGFASPFHWLIWYSDLYQRLQLQRSSSNDTFKGQWKGTRSLEIKKGVVWIRNRFWWTDH